MNNETNNIDGEIQSMTCMQTQLARALNLSKQRINQLIDEGIVVRDETSFTGQVMFFESLQNFFLSRSVKLGGEISVNFWKERGLHEKAKRELAEIKLAQARGELYDATTVESVLSELLTNFRSKLLGLPAKFATQLEGKSRDEINSMLTAEIEENISELTERLANVSFVDNNADDELI